MELKLTNKMLERIHVQIKKRKAQMLNDAGKKSLASTPANAQRKGKKVEEEETYCRYLSTRR